ncbi:Ty3/gypsy retrotransposon protein [Quillaja saponaria]|uniref:Ty3/gypsy retrotransposon protein n=1 Tax=Quillaja saponaria TaxID=32244 RepID=A0AAD7QJ70_QUISA|nr:Ty3/gypsy retrotransposon protein [Quillaja saponaria]
MHGTTFPKLSAKYFGPYKVIAKIGTVAYALELPEGSKIHNIFHVSRLKRHHGQILGQPQLPVFDDSGHLLLEPVAVIDRRTIKKNNKAVVQVLVHWSNSSREDCTWEDFHVLKSKFSQFRP